MDSMSARVTEDSLKSYRRSISFNAIVASFPPVSDKWFKFRCDINRQRAWSRKGALITRVGCTKQRIFEQGGALLTHCSFGWSVENGSVAGRSRLLQVVSSVMVWSSGIFGLNFKSTSDRYISVPSSRESRADFESFREANQNECVSVLFWAWFMP